MSDLAATNCGCGCECTTGGNGSNSIFLILILLCCCGNGGFNFGCGCGGNSCGNSCGIGFGCDIVMSKWIGLEGTAILASAANNSFLNTGNRNDS